MLVTAPTGSGKTEVAMKAIERILKKSDDGRIYYVCPTRALVHQCYAEVCARFKKHYAIPDYTMLGLITSEFQISPHAQVVITVPEILRAMLLDESNSQLMNLECVVLDEIHSIR